MERISNGANGVQFDLIADLRWPADSFDHGPAIDHILNVTLQHVIRNFVRFIRQPKCFSVITERGFRLFGYDKYHLHRRFELQLLKRAGTVGYDSTLFERFLVDRIADFFQCIGSKPVHAYITDNYVVRRFATPKAGDVKLISKLSRCILHGFLHPLWFDFDSQPGGMVIEMFSLNVHRILQSLLIPGTAPG